MTGAERHRAAETIPIDLVSAFLADHGKLDLRHEAASEPSDDEEILRSEFVAIMEARGAEEPIQEAGTIDGVCAGGDELEREAAVEELAEMVGADTTDDKSLAKPGKEEI